VDYSDARQCLALINALPLTKLNQVHESLAQMIGGMQASPPAPFDYLEVLEIARPPLDFVQEEMAGRYAQSALPPGGVEDETLRRVVTLWQAMARAYAQVAQLGGEDAQVQSRLALICHRCIHYSARAMREYFRARRELPKGLWIDLHGYYSTAEEWGIATIEVSDPLNQAYGRQSCAQAYAAALLLDLGNPYSRSPREFGWLCRWSERFAALTGVTTLDSGGTERSYVIDLLKDRGPMPLQIAGPGEAMRHLTTTELAAEMHRVVGDIKRKTAPAELGLGDDCFEPGCSRLLVSLYRPWCLAASPRRFHRRPTGGSAQLCYGFEAIHYYVSGEEFKQPEHVRIYTRDEVNSIMTFRHQVDPAQHLHVRAAQIGYTLENWAVADESVGGFRLLRFGTGVRLEHGQLLGLRPPDGERFLLCQASWLMYLASGALMVGVYVLPGAAQPIAARLSGIGANHSDRYMRAFLLPAMPALKQAPTLVLPKGWFQPGRVLEIYTDRRIELRLLEALNHGTDFDRVSYSPLAASP
jgi:hypothetical protein